MTRDQLEGVLAGLDAEALRAALLLVGAFARAGRGAESALWWGLAEALRAPSVPWELGDEARAATLAAVAARRDAA